MDIKSGYKQTEVGVIPEDWDVKRLGELVDQRRKITYGIVVPGPETVNGVPLIRAQDYSKGWVSIDDLYRVSHKIDETYKRSRVRTGDVLLTIVGSVGNVASVPQLFNGSNITQQTARLSFNNEVANATYYHNLLLSDVGKRTINNFTKSGVQPSLNLSDVDKFMLPHPPLPEQKAIAQALSDMDALISGLDDLIAKKRDIKQATMQQLLTGKTRLPGFSGEWRSHPLSKFVRRFIVPMRDKPTNLTGDIPWCRIEDFSGTYLFGSKTNQCVTASVVEMMNLKVYPTGTLLVSCSADLGRCAIVGKPLVSNQTFIGLEFDDTKGSNIFFFYLMSSKATELNNLSSGTTISYLPREKFESFVVYAPDSVEEQKAIGKVLTDIDAELEALEQRREKTRELKQAMMQELLTGRTRLV
jgi:type I restriction enzyme S subunit